VGVLTAITAHRTAGNLLAQIRIYGALAGCGFRRYATYRQATVAGAVTNTVFGFLRCFVLLDVAAGTGGVAADYGGEQLATYVWLVRACSRWCSCGAGPTWPTGPQRRGRRRPAPAGPPRGVPLATELGRAGCALLFRFVPPASAAAASRMAGRLTPYLYLLGAQDDRSTHTPRTCTCWAPRRAPRPAFEDVVARLYTEAHADPTAGRGTGRNPRPGGRPRGRPGGEPTRSRSRRRVRSAL
jgi:hypothetical protein